MNPWWQEVVDTLEAEFSDLTDASELTRITVRLVIAAVLGGVLGFEREHQGKAAGMRTHMLVAMGAALFVLVPSMAGSDAQGAEPGRAGNRCRYRPFSAPGPFSRAAATTPATSKA